jgi:response regulator RpfG family c-di-GMP phosphodiesterase
MRGSERLGDVAEIALHRHERWDGSGAPDRLAGERIPPEARVVACVDAFLSVREVSTGDAESMRLVESLAGTVLDPALPEVLGEILAAEARPAAA